MRHVRAGRVRGTRPRTPLHFLVSAHAGPVWPVTARTGRIGRDGSCGGLFRRCGGEGRQLRGSQRTAVAWWVEVRRRRCEVSVEEPWSVEEPDGRSGREVKSVVQGSSCWKVKTSWEFPVVLDLQVV